ncbi:hypothetical protein CEXT_790601 [Caerostris extrusa]|uniref:Uncharacterized protein n=1 Tax=Caerostris extrusa TaxID=172846 RepID=A0AAV4MA04_CAEEX|nr:hypothetical protein CEXT_790601 [Caerostris extrusa]
MDQRQLRDNLLHNRRNHHAGRSAIGGIFLQATINIEKSKIVQHNNMDIRTMLIYCWTAVGFVYGIRLDSKDLQPQLFAY